MDDGEYELICTSHYDPTTQMNYETCGVIQIAGEADGHIDYYSADVMTANDYYPSCILTVLVKTSL